MLRPLLLLLLVFAAGPSLAQKQLNRSLKQELDSMFVLDQKYRHLMSEATDPTKADSLAKAFGVEAGNLPVHLWQLQEKVDQTNLKRAEEIIRQHGYPGKSLVGEPTNQAVWHIIQHAGENSGKIQQYFPLIEQAGKKGELEKTWVAMMQDRMLMHEGKEQIYGTQGRCERVQDPVTQAEGQDCFIWPIKDPAKVNERRREVGFDTTVEENAKRMGFTYAVRKLPAKPANVKRP